MPDMIANVLGVVVYSIVSSNIEGKRGMWSLDRKHMQLTDEVVGITE